MTERYLSKLYSLKPIADKIALLIKSKTNGDYTATYNKYSNCVEVTGKKFHKPFLKDLLEIIGSKDFVIQRSQYSDSEKITIGIF